MAHPPCILKVTTDAHVETKPGRIGLNAELDRFGFRLFANCLIEAG